jgi:hypothetical protein
MILTSLIIFLGTAIALHLIHARIAPSHEKLRTPAGRVLLELAPSTELARRLSQGRIRHPLAVLYRFLWYVHLFAGLAFALSLTYSAYLALR